jgi:hypothetical protein
MRPLLRRISGPGAEEPLDVWEHIAMAEFLESFRGPLGRARDLAEEECFEWHARYYEDAERSPRNEEEWPAWEDWEPVEAWLEGAGE